MPDTLGVRYSVFSVFIYSLFRKRMHHFAGQNFEEDEGKEVARCGGRDDEGEEREGKEEKKKREEGEGIKNN
jgi:hypothetical protein